MTDAPSSPTADRAGFVFILLGAVGMLAALGLLLGNAYRGQAQPLLLLGIMFGVAFLVAVFGAVMIAPERAGIALGRVQQAAAPYLPAGREPVRLAVPDGGAVVAAREPYAPDVLVEPTGAPQQLRADTPPAEAAAVVAQREPTIAERAARRQPRRAAVTRDASRVDVPTRTRAPRKRTAGGKFAKHDAGDLDPTRDAWKAEQKAIRAGSVAQLRTQMQEMRDEIAALRAGAPGGPVVPPAAGDPAPAPRAAQHGESV